MEISVLAAAIQSKRNVVRVGFRAPLALNCHNIELAPVIK